MIFFKTAFSSLGRGIKSNLFIFFLVLVALFLIGNILLRGFDFSDESFYLLLTLKPEAYTNRLYLFGYITRILYQLGGNNIVNFRFIGLFLLLGSSFSFLQVLLSILKEKGVIKITNKLRYFTQFIFAIPILFYYGLLATPSYNLLNFVFILLSSSFLFLGLKSNKLIYFFVTGFFLSLMLFSKFTSLVVFYPLIILLILFYEKSRRNIKKIFLLTLSTLLFVVLFTILIDGNVLVFINNFIASYYAQSLLKSGHGVWSIFKKLFFEVILSYGVQFSIVLLLSYRHFKGKRSNLINKLILWLVRGYFFTSLILLLLLLIQFFGALPFSIKPLSFTSFLRFYLGFFLINGIFISYLYFMPSIFKQFSKNRPFLFIALFLLLLPIIASFGSNDSYYYTISYASGFVVFSLLLIFLLGLKSQLYKVKYLGVILLIIFINFLVNLNINPYRLDTNYLKQDTPVSFFQDNSTLLVSKSTANYINKVKEIKVKYFPNSQPLIIDLTNGVGNAFIMDGNPIGFPWLFSYYPGTNDFAYHILKKAERKYLNNAIVITTPSGNSYSNIRLNINPNLLLKDMLGLPFPENYTLIGKVYNSLKKCEISFWKQNL